MTGQRLSKKSNPSGAARARRRRAIGLGGGVGAFLAFGLGPLAGTPPAKADIFDDILDMAVGSRSANLTSPELDELMRLRYRTTTVIGDVVPL